MCRGRGKACSKRHRLFTIACLAIPKARDIDLGRPVGTEHIQIACHHTQRGPEQLRGARSLTAWYVCKQNRVGVCLANTAATGCHACCMGKLYWHRPVSYMIVTCSVRGLSGHGSLLCTAIKRN